MPFAPKRPCKKPACGSLVESGGNGYCETHVGLGRQQNCERWAAHDRTRGNSAERGYDARWRRFRTWFLNRHPMCESDKGCNRAADEVHHIHKISDGGARLDEMNCMALCRLHHLALAGKGGRG